MNPFLRPRGMMEAQRSARAMVFGLLVSTVVGLPITLWMLDSNVFEESMSSQYAAAGLDADAVAMQQAIMEGLMPAMMIFSLIVSVVLYGGLAWAQWRYMTRAIPIILLALSAYGIVSNVIIRTTGIYPIPEMPVWHTMLTWVTFAFCTVIYAASLRGALLLHELRKQP